MPSLLQGYVYDIFISYRQKDNKGDHWVTGFVNALKTELEATFKEEISIYFDENPRDGLLETHDVDDSLKDKLKCLIFIPVISQTYCDPKSFAWNNEFLAFKKSATENSPGLKVKLAGGNTASRILPVRIHELDDFDRRTIENEVGPLRAVDFIYKEPGVNRPLKPGDNRSENLNHTDYRNQVNKVANAVKDILAAIRTPALHPPPATSGDADMIKESVIRTALEKNRFPVAIIATLLLLASVYFFFGLERYFIRGKEINQKSIAVIPFKNMSEREANQHVCDGVMEAILNHLAKLKDLQVTSRTSMEQYRPGRTQKSVPEIARELGVAHILEGSVQQAGGKLKVTAQLINAETDRHVWSEEYVRDEDDLFALQTEIAKEVAKVLNVTLSRQEQEQIARVPTQNMEAWNVYLQAQASFAHDWFSPHGKDYQKTMRLCDLALALDPELAEAYTLKADAYYWANWLKEIYSEHFMDSAVRWSETALRIDPKSGAAHRTLGVYLLNTGRKQEAKDHFLAAAALEPNDIQTSLALSYYYRLTKDYEEAYTATSKALSLAPQSVWLPRLYVEFAWIYHDICDFKKSIEALDKAIALEPALRTHGLKSWTYVVLGEADKVRSWAETIMQSDSASGLASLAGYYAYFEPEKALKYQVEFQRKYPDLANQPGGGHRYAHALWAAGRKEEAMNEFDKAREYLIKSLELGRLRTANYYDLAGIESFLGNTAKAKEYLHTYDGQDWPGAIPHFVQVDPMFDNLRSDPEFKAMVKEAQERKARIRERIRKLDTGL